MSLSLINIAKRFKKDWVFRNVNYEFEIPGTYVIKGSNGSGKSTFLKLISSYLSPSEGNVELSIDSKDISVEDWPKQLAYAAPYFELIEEMFLEEFVEFYIQFKPLRVGISKDELIRIAYLEGSRNKQIKNFSSGMKQRLRLALAWLSDVSIILLDEPTANLDRKGIDWYQNLAKQYSKGKLIIVCSNNIEEEYFFCEQSLNIEDFSS